ncbi:MAG: bifunctional riboflavin kinase/FAD synthetase [Alphaproteobacteria bacterium]|jgi:riboflavin kinase/FMN adenylyltransferase|uniref:bifunctional riboflavin kinase/FAD synthetase n=1 Tax=Loktanella salsilacus TaxID=195913 RepID=UPI001ED02503|nr:bifunctional riboflavin kinase/FAD synthetase [Loktanella salsilacus]MBU0862625.1 bifunctional riboflavin kinase/FAD synthetase [Alphaproteobacteria bacterium]UTH48563.1 bifunctional riboflavin kinase/FAD synthetase [Loktanella salsilacus]
MRIIRDTLYLDPSDRGAAAAIGNFDGVHLGHRAVIDAARGAATQLGAPLGLMTFEPHPRQLFAADAPPFRLMNAEARANELAKQGVEKLYEVPFNAALVALSPREFAQTVIHDRLGLAHVVIGADFCFGKDRAGNAADLQRYGAEMGFGVTVAPMVALEGGRVSSTAIRTALSDGKPRDAAAMLGHWHRIVGEVIRGDQRGRELGYPTANMSIEGLHPPKFGVYAVRVDIAKGPHAGRYDGAASIGVRPMFNGEVPNCETFIFDFKGDLYGQHISVALVDYLRPELKFDGLPALIDQMDADCTKAREILSHV